jgi:hypothetical protein
MTKLNEVAEGAVASDGARGGMTMRSLGPFFPIALGLAWGLFVLLVFHRSD